MKQVLVVSDNDLLLVGIRRLLNQADQFSIKKVSSFDERELINSIDETTCNVVIVDGFFAKNGSLELTHLLNTIRGLRILIMQIDSNMVQIYDKREFSLEQTSDLTDYF